MLKHRFDDKIYVGYHKQEIVDSVDQIKHDLVREAAKVAGMATGFEVKTMADVPSKGSGLGSSSAYLVGLLNAFYHYQNRPKDNEYLGYQAFYIEKYSLGRSVGMQDHLLSAFGGQNKIYFSKHLPTITPIKLSSDNLLLHFTGITRNANTILKDMAKIIKEKEYYYQQLYELARDFTEENLETSLAVAWELKKELSKKITNPQIEKMAENARMYGANACKILGAGGGGFLLSYVPKKYQDEFLEHMSEYKELKFNFTNYGTRIIYNGL